MLCWLFNGRAGGPRFILKGDLWVGLASDDLQNAYHVVPNSPHQLNLCVVALRNPKTNKMEFYISYAHLFGLSAAVVNFNRLPELMTAITRRIGQATSWHFFDDQGTLDFERRLQQTSPFGTVVCAGQFLQASGQPRAKAWKDQRNY